MPPIKHIHLPGLTPYATASALQSTLSSHLLAYKALLSKPTTLSTSTQPQPSPPPPTILTFTPLPTYTHGRRAPSPPSPSQLASLLEPLTTESHGRFTPTFANDLRGGQTTFHGPGQLVIWPLFSLSHPYSFASARGKEDEKENEVSDGEARDGDIAKGKRSLSPRCYVSLLESVTIATLSHYGIKGIRTTDPGVWRADGEKKIAALGVHLRRNVTSFGVGLNVDTDAKWWERIVACGLEDKGVTSIAAEGGRVEEMDRVARTWVEEFARQVGTVVEDLGRVPVS